MKIDVISISLTSMISSLGFFLALILIWRFYLRRNEFFFWGISQLFYPIGLIMLNCRDVIPDFFSIIAGNVFLLGTYSCLWIGLDIYFGKKPKYMPIAAIITIYIASASYFTYISPNISLRISIFSSFAVFFSIVMARALLISRPKPGISIETAAASSLIFDALIKLFTAGAQFFTLGTPQPFHNNYFIGVNILLTTITNVIWNISVFLMVFNDAFEKTRIMEKKALESKNLLESVINAIPTRVFWKDSALKYLGANMHFIRDAGLSHIDELAGKNDDDLIWKDRAGSYNNDNLEVIQSGTPKLNIEEMTIGVDGTKNYFLISKVPLRDSEGRITGIVGAYQDITAQKTAQNNISALLAEKELLLKEVNHRIKNNMSMVSSLLYMQAVQLGKTTIAGEALLETHNRLQGMSIIYDKLYRSADYKNLPVREYLDALIDEILSAYGDFRKISFVRDIEDFELDSNLLFPAGIIINEILTNSCKYAFPPQQGLETENIIEISVRKTPEKMVALSVKDNGVGFAVSQSPRADKSFGLRLIELLTRQLKASVSIDSKSGTAYHIIFPMEVIKY